MKIREIFQAVFWSKKALRRNLIGFGIVVCVLVGVLGILYEGEGHWLTPGERRTGRATLAQIDAIQNLETISRDDFEVREQGLSEKLEAARNAAWTRRDKGAYTILFVYLLATEQERADAWEQNQLQAKGSSISNPDRAFTRKKIGTEKEELRFYGKILHHEFD
jgi:hypothetical protein